MFGSRTARDGMKVNQMSEDETRKVFEELKKKYPSLSDEAIADIMKTGADRGIIQVAEPESGPHSETDEPVFNVLEALKKGDLSIGEAILFDSYLERKTGKSSKDEIMALLKEGKAGKDGGTDLRAIMSEQMQYDLLEEMIEARRERARAKTQPLLQGTGPVDMAKLIQEMGDKMTDALRTHKLEDEKERAEERARAAQKRADEAEAKLELQRKSQEDDQKLEKRVKETVSPLEAKYEKLLKEIGDRLKNVNPEERRGLMLNLEDMINEELGEEIKGRIVEGIKGAFGEKDSSPVTTDASGKAQLDWYKFGERILKTVEKFADKLPTRAASKKRREGNTASPNRKARIRGFEGKRIR